MLKLKNGIRQWNNANFAYSAWPACEDSHFLSAGIYRILRDDDEKNPNPWVLWVKELFRVLRRMKARCCARRLRAAIVQHGENWF